MEPNEEMQTQEPEEVEIVEIDESAVPSEPVEAEEKPVEAVAKPKAKKKTKKPLNYQKLYKEAVVATEALQEQHELELKEVQNKLAATENLLEAKKQQLDQLNEEFNKYKANVAKTLRFIDTNVTSLANSTKLVLKGEL